MRKPIQADRPIWPPLPEEPARVPDDERAGNDAPDRPVPVVPVPVDATAAPDAAESAAYGLTS